MCLWPAGRVTVVMLGPKRKVVNTQRSQGVAQEATKRCFLKERLIVTLLLLQLRARRPIPFLAVRAHTGREKMCMCMHTCIHKNITHSHTPIHYLEDEASGIFGPTAAACTTALGLREQGLLADENPQQAYAGGVLARGAA